MSVPVPEPSAMRAVCGVMAAWTSCTCSKSACTRPWWSPASQRGRTWYPALSNKAWTRSFRSSLPRCMAVSSITIACSRLRRSLDLLCVVENALRAFSTTHNKSFARRSRASTRHALKDTTYYVHIINHDVGGKLDEGSANWREQDQGDTHTRTERRRGHSGSYPAGAGLFGQQYLYRRHGCARL